MTKAEAKHLLDHIDGLAKRATVSSGGVYLYPQEVTRVRNALHHIIEHTCTPEMREAREKRDGT